jgi:hypothetical protein
MATKRDIFYPLLNAYMNPDVDDHIKNYLSDMVKQNPDIIPPEALSQVEQLQMQEIDAFLQTDPATWGENFEQLRRHVVFALKIWERLDEGDVPQA